MKKPNKDTIRKNIKNGLNREWKGYFIDYPFKQMTLKNMQDLFKEYAKNNNLDIDSMYLETSYNYDGHDDLYIYGYQTMTPKQIEDEVENIFKEEMENYKSWQAKQKINKQEKEKYEKEEYERLKKKYGP